MKKITSLTEIEKITNGDQQTMKELLQIFIGESSTQILKLNECSKGSSWDELKRVAHKIKSSLLLIGMSAYRPLAEELEQSAGTDLKKTKKQVDELTEVYTMAIAELKIILKDLS